MKYVVVVVVLCSYGGSSVAYNTNREPLAQWSANSYNPYQPDPFAVDVSSNLLQEQSGKLFWDKWGNTNQGTNQVGGTGLWNHFANKFPYLNNIFGSRMEMPTLYGPPQVEFRGTPNYFYAVQPYYPPGVQVTDDAVVVSAPGVAPVAPAPAAPAPTPGGYNYPRPQYRLELPQRNNLK